MAPLSELNIPGRSNTGDSFAPRERAATGIW